MERQKMAYEPPTIEKVTKMRFPTEILDKHGKRTVCKQCSSCHSCR